MNPHWHAVVMAGGAGTRFWPASRKSCPKQFLCLGPDPNETLIAATVRRLLALFPPERILIATGVHLVEATQKALPQIPAQNILAEPVPRNTAPCIAWATATIQRRDPKAVIAVLSADHAVKDEASFQAVLEQAMRVAEGGTIATVGVVPTRAETGYGYIEVGPKRQDGAHQALRFVEKPTHERAVEMLESKRFVWNAGYFFFQAPQMMLAIAKHLPELAEGMRQLDAAALMGDEAEALGRVFPTLTAVSIDVGVMEKVSPLAVVPGDFGWSDVGSWQAAWELAKHDGEGNAAPPDAVLVDSHNNYVADWRSEPGPSRKAIALLGVEDLVVVETDDALLVMPRGRSQDVRQVVNALGKKGHGQKL